MVSRTGRGSLTARQNEIYEYVCSVIEKTLAPPTIPEIASHFRLKSTNGVFEHLQALEAKGYIERIPGKARGIRLLDPSAVTIGGGAGSATSQIPIVGEGNSSNPFSIFLRPRGMFTPDPATMPTDNAFVAIVSDDGMDKEGIFKGDYAIVQQTSDLKDGMLVFALLGDNALVRRLDASGPRSYLRAVNRHYKKEAVMSGSPDVALIGKVVSILRKVG